MLISNVEKARARCRAYHQAHKDEIREYKKGYYKANRDKVLAYHRKRYEANRANKCAYQRAYHKANRDKIIAKSRERRYQITSEHYEKLLHHQDRKCAICKQGKRLFVDHNHQTGIVRGLLCNACNLAIGILQENVKFLASAIDYLSSRARPAALARHSV